MSDLSETLAQRMRSARAERGLSLQEVGDLSGMTKSHVWEIEQGRSKNPTVQTILGLCYALDMSPADFLGLDMNDDRRKAILKLANHLEGITQALRELAYND